MDTIGTLTIALALNKYDLSVTLHKYYSADDLGDFFSAKKTAGAFYSMRINKPDYDKLCEVKKPIAYVCAGVANGYTFGLRKH